MWMEIWNRGRLHIVKDYKLISVNAPNNVHA